MNTNTKLSKFQQKKVDKQNLKNQKNKDSSDKTKLLNLNNDYRYILVLDFEANCDDVNPPPLEITEFPIVVLDLETNTINRELDFSHFVKINTPITKFCTQLTTITQEMSDSGDKLQETIKKLDIWMLENNFINNYIFVTCGDWDLKTALPTNAEFLNMKYPSYLKKWCNIKVIYEEVYKEKSYGMANMLDKLNLTLDGTHHRGIDDCANIAKICQAIINSGYKLRITNFI
jgi:inhibitor of KinA sporulation pathway (predicted exonuclease)